MAVRNFEADIVRDIEGDQVPHEKMLIFELADLHASRGARLRDRA